MYHLLTWLGSFLLFLGPAAAQTDLRSDLINIIDELKSPDAFGIEILPEEAQYIKHQIEDNELIIDLDLGNDFLYTQLDDEVHDEIIEHFAGDLSEYDFTAFFIRAKNQSGNLLPLSEYLSEKPIAITPIIENADPSPAIKGKSFKDNYSDVQPEGQLDGSTIWLSAGHGWIYDKRFRTFRTQRHNTHGLVEDFSNAEAINYHLLKYLYNAGANIWTVRERDMNSNEVIVDNDAGNPAYEEFGRWATSSTPGRKGQTYRYAVTQKKETATAHFTPKIPESGMYWVSVHYQNGYNRSVDARYRIVHAGGESHVSINQEVHGNTWVYLGQFYFEKGTQGKVILSNQSLETKQAVIADAVRFGGGMGDLGDCYSGHLSGTPRYEEGSKYYARYMGYPDCEGDVGIRPKYAEWELAKGTQAEKQNAIYLSWHSNASGGRGTETFIHRSNRRVGTRALQQAIHNELIKDIRKSYDPSWKDRGQKAANFGELRGLRTMPGVLLEIGFHDHHRDAEAISDPQFRNIVARATYKGIVRYFAKKNKVKPVFLPEPPSHLIAQNAKSGTIELSWKAPEFGGVLGDKAIGYQVYISTHGKAFAAGTATRQNNFSFKNLRPGTTYYFKVTATNAGGESFPTAVVAARTPANRDEVADFLIVDGFDRLDRSLAITQKESRPSYAPLGNTRRLFIERMNNYDYAMAHATSMAASGLAFDGATNEAVIDRRIDLDQYYGINWFLGRESKTDATLDIHEQRLLKRFLDGGGVLMISGSELAFDLVKSGNGKSFYHNYLKADFVGDDARQNRVTSFVNDQFGGIDAYLVDKNFGAYPMKSPDILRSINGSRPILQYKNGRTAAVAFHGDFSVVNFGFPLEAIGDDELRHELFKRSILFMAPDRRRKIETVFRD